jgi:hypothetical protein
MMTAALKHVDLALDPQAGQYVKQETVRVEFANKDGQLLSREGVNHYLAGDALITGSTGDRWSVTRARFDAKYEAVAPCGHGRAGEYAAKPVPVWAKQVAEPFTIARCTGGDVLRGEANDWVLQYAPGDYGVVQDARFRQVYRPVG